MLALAKRHPGNDDVAVLAAEAAMNTSPWNYWDESKTQPRPRMGEGIALLEQVIARSPQHSQAAHLYIHLMENSTDPKIAEAAADRLRASAPAALGHLVHMPAHIYYRIGRYSDSIDANIAAARADEAYLAQVGDDGLYRFSYYPHNVHFLLTSAQMVGDMGTVANETARLTRIIDVEAAKHLPWVEGDPRGAVIRPRPVRLPRSDLGLDRRPFRTRLCRGNAPLCARNRAGAQGLPARPMKANWPPWPRSRNPRGVRDGGCRLPGARSRQSRHAGRARKTGAFRGKLYRRDRIFEQAEAIEATIPCNEPPYWYYPVAQSRGAALYAAGRYREAKAAFMKALIAAPNDGWALYGLEQTERKRGDRPAALATRKAFERVWRGDDSWLRMDRL